MNKTASFSAVDSISLDGLWSLHRPSKDQSWPAIVPGCVHSDLRREGVLAPLEWRDNEATQQWLDAETWVYRRTFNLTEGQLKDATPELVCDGLDTLSTVSLNGKVVMETDNMFRTWRSPVAPYLRAGENTIEITFHSTLPVIAAGQSKVPLREWNIYFDRHLGRGYVRKMSCSYGWDWAPIAPTAGIWKNIRLEFIRAARWDDVHIRQKHSAGEVTLDIQWKTTGPGNVHLELSKDGKIIAQADAASSVGKATLVVKNPELWWPNTLGAQPLYDFSATLTESNGKQDHWKGRLGLRTLRLVRDKDEIGESFYFEVNGKMIFSKGANWIPIKILLPEITREDYRKLLQDTADANMNMLRVWGGGIYESDDFYDLCDELGILVWQDFMFACGQYPSWDEKFMANVEAEARDNVRRIRHHASLALWCGNNELEGAFANRGDYTWEVYGLLFDKLLPKVCTELDPDTAYWPSSPHTPVGDREHSGSDLSGDTHHWSVFFGGQPIESQRSWRTRFMSEFGFQSYPEIRTVESYTAPEDRVMMSRILDYHQRSEAGNKTIMSFLFDWFQLPSDYADVLIVSQLVQSLCVRYATEHLRRIQPLCGGVLYWQINDIWPCSSWSSIDSFGRWKALQYDAKRFFAPVVVSIEEDLVASTAKVHVSNQLPTDATLEVRWQITDTDGEVLIDEKKELKVASQSGEFVADLDAKPLLKKYHAYDLMIWAWVSEKGKVIGRNWVPLARPKHLSISDPQIKTEIRTTAEGTFIHLSCEKPAPYVVLSLKNHDVRFDDNFFHLHPGESRVIKMTQGPTVDVVRSELCVKSLSSWMTARKAGEALAPKPEGYELQRKR
jgi:beta-mannosidase